ncbi:MAG TPA: BON domain-containing protein [Thermoanaerobaculia bacterium]|nr:BON domain-containing protein [Thermoanaerobaculia bacterium]
MRAQQRGVKAWGIAILVALTAAALLSAGCASTRTTGEQMDDGWINTKIKAKLTSDTSINSFNIDVHVLEGVVTLKGKVEKEESKRRAARYAERTKGVKQVINEIEIES